MYPIRSQIAGGDRGISFLISLFSILLNRSLFWPRSPQNFESDQSVIGRRILTPGGSQRSWKDQNDSDCNDTLPRK